jgi:uncharacterized membrane protein
MSQYIIIGGDGNEYGPVSTEEVREWVQAGRANGDTRIKPVDAEDWGRLRDFPEFEPNVSPGSAPPLPPVEGAAQSPPPLPGGGPLLTADQLMQELQGRPHTFSMGECFSRGWRLVMDNFGLLLLTVLALMGLSIVSALVPFGQLVCAGPLMGGTYYIFLKRLRNEPAEVGNIFVGFRDAFMPLFLVNLFMMLAIFAGCIPLIGGAIVGFVTGIAEASAGSPPIFTILIIALSFIISMLLVYTIWGMLIFGIPLALDRRMEGVEAFKATWRITKNCWGKCLLLMICTVLVNFVGILVLCFGMLVTMPLSIAMTAVAYEHLFGKRTPK